LNSQAAFPAAGTANNPLGSSEHLDLMRTAELCREAARESDLERLESRVAAFRAVERRFKTYLELASLDLQAAESKLDESKQRHARLKSLLQSGVATSAEYDKADGESKAGEFEVQRARITKDFYEQVLDEAQVTVKKALETVKKRAEESDADASVGTIR
jgi:multidrug resistance efflux pump